MFPLVYILFEFNVDEWYLWTVYYVFYVKYCFLSVKKIHLIIFILQNEWSLQQCNVAHSNELKVVEITYTLPYN